MFLVTLVYARIIRAYYTSTGIKSWCHLSLYFTSKYKNYDYEYTRRPTQKGRRAAASVEYVQPGAGQ